MPFPFVSGLIGGHSYTKPGKKVFFTKRPDDKEVLAYQLQQITLNETKKKNDQENIKNQDNELIKTIKLSVAKEEMKKRKFAELFKSQYKVGFMFLIESIMIFLGIQ